MPVSKEPPIEELANDVAQGFHDGLLFATALFDEFATSKDVADIAAALNTQFSDATQRVMLNPRNWHSQSYVSGLTSGMVPHVEDLKKSYAHAESTLAKLATLVPVLRVVMLETCRNDIEPAHRGHQDIREDFTCDRCGARVKGMSDIGEAIHLSFAGGGCSVFGDGAEFSWELCDPCAYELFGANCAYW